MKVLRKMWNKFLDFLYNPITPALCTGIALAVIWGVIYVKQIEAIERIKIGLNETQEVVGRLK